MNAHINTKNQIDLPDSFTDISTLLALQKSLKQSHQRLIVNLRGSRLWCLSGIQSQQELSQNSVVLSNQQDIQKALPFSKAEILLGQESECVVYDGFSGINIDVLCMAAGLVKAGGVLVLLMPEDTGQVEDVYGQWQGSRNSNQFFLNYLIRYLEQDMLVIKQHEKSVTYSHNSLPESPLTAIKNGLTEEQAELLKSLDSWIKQMKKPLFLLTADRGRGKSTALGLFASQQNSSTGIVVTAASRAQVAILLKQLGSQQSNIHFLAPDDIIRQNHRIELLLIDEAAMLPHNMLEQCVNLSDKVLISTTTGGYEGTGQGFLIKFIEGFDAADYIHHQMKLPVRWGQNDLLEKWMNKILLFNSQKNPDQLTLNDISIQLLSKKQLSDDEEKLKTIYKLLVSAHYRTKPSDLRQLMEDDNQQVLIACSAGVVIGVLLLNKEGGFGEALSHDVFMGKRRPQGHLFAQMITAQAGVKNFACFNGYRIQRIAVTESCRKQGIGRLLIKQAEQLVKQNGLDYLASSFALDDSVTPFWKVTGFAVVHIGSGKGKSTGRQAIAVIKSFNPEVDGIVSQLNLKLREYLPVWFLSYCQSMLWIDVLALLELINIKYEFSDQDKDEIFAFSEGFRGFDLTQSVLQKMIITQLRLNSFDEQLSRLLVEKILLNKDWKQLSDSYGKKEMLKKIRQCIFQLNKQVDDE